MMADTCRQVPTSCAHMVQEPASRRQNVMLMEPQNLLLLAFMWSPASS